MLQLRKTKKRCSQIFREVSGVFQQNFNGSKNSAVLEPRTVQFSWTTGFEAKDFKMCPRGHPGGKGRPQRLHLWYVGKKLQRSFQSSRVPRFKMFNCIYSRIEFMKIRFSKVGTF